MKLLPVCRVIRLEIIPVFLRGVSILFPKNFDEVACPAKAAGDADICDRVICVDQIVTGFLQPDLLEIFEGGGVQLLFKGTVTFPLTAQAGFRNLIQCDLFDIMFIHIGDHRLDPCG